MQVRRLSSSYGYTRELSVFTRSAEDVIMVMESVSDYPEDPYL